MSLSTKAAVITAMLGLLPQLSPAETPAAIPSWLSHRQGQLLQQAARGDYTVTLLSGPVAGIDRHVVLLGEVHCKAEEADALGRALLDQFPLRGLEGVDLTKLPKWAVAMMMPGLLVLEGVRGAYARLSNRDYESTIFAASEPESTGTSPSQSHEAAGSQPTINIYLEDGSSPLAHALGFNSLWASLVIPFAMPVAWLLQGTRLGLGLEFSPAMELGMVLVLGYGILNLVALETTLIVEQQAIMRLSSWLAPLFPMPYYFQGYRNQTMAGNIIKTFDNNPEQTVMLVVVGKGHNGGLTMELEGRYGFHRETGESRQEG